MRRNLMVLVLSLLLAAPGAFAEEARKSKKKKGLKGKPKVAVGVNLHSMWSHAFEGEPGNQFSTEMARLQVKFKQGKTIDAKLQGDFDELFGEGKKKAMMRDAWVRVRPVEWLGIKVGQQKRPFSRVQLRSMGKFETVWRGPADKWVSKELKYGDRDIGATLAFDLEFDEGRKLLITMGAFNGTGKNEPETDPNGAKDVVGRVEGSPVEWLSLGVSGALKFFDHADDDVRPAQAFATGVDLQVDWKGLLVIAEGLYGENWDPCLFSDAYDSCIIAPSTAGVPNSFWPTSELVPKTWSAVLLVAYKTPIYKAWRLSVQPVFKGEVFDPDAEGTGGRVVVGTLGVNWWVGKHFRLMIQGETVRPEASAPARWFEENRLMTQVAFDL